LTARKGPFSEWFRKHFSRASNVVIEICSALRHALSRWRRQHRDPPQHACEEPARQMTLCQQQPVVPGMLYQTPAGFHEPLLQAGQRPKSLDFPAFSGIE
jgi:hypothetical protein